MVGSVGAVIAIAAIMSVLSTPGQAISAPIPSDQPVTVVIPESSSNSNPHPTPSRGGGERGDSESSPQPSAPPTNADGSPKPPGEPTKGAGKLKADHERIETRGWMTVTGTGFTPGEKVQIVVYSEPIVTGSFLADGVGGLSARFLIPEQLRPGTHSIEATGWISRHVANVEFTVVTATVAESFPARWWLIVVLGVLVTGAISTAIYFRHSIARWFGGGAEPAGSAL